jgi:hypothetical protein
MSSIFRNRFSAFCTKLLERVPNLCLWAASWRGDHIPERFVVESMHTMLRCPPMIHREVKQSEMIGVDCDRQVKVAWGKSTHTSG